MLSTDEYSHLMRNWSVLKDNIKEMARQEVFHEKKCKECEDRKDALLREEDFYTNFLKDAIGEYEEAHPPPEPPEGA